jgi:hypothetical protein
VARTASLEQPAPGRHRLLDLDPDLGELLGLARRREAWAALTVRVTALPTGAWDVDGVAAAHPANLGLLVCDGVIAREVVVGDTVSTELTGPGDLLRPWRMRRDPDLVSVTVRWNVLAPARLALLDRALAQQLGQWPEVNAALVDRMSQRTHRVAVTQAISQLHRVDQRLLGLLWHLAGRFGRVTTEGTLLPLALSHRLLSELVGARRPTVSTALGELSRDGKVLRRRDGTWLLVGDPEDLPVSGSPTEVVRQRRPLIPAPPAGPAAAPSLLDPPAAA